MHAPRRFLVITVWLSLLLACLWLVLTRIPISTDLEPFVLDDSPTGKLLAQLNAGPAQRLILIGIGGGSERQRAQASRRLAAVLQADSRFVRVMNGAGGLDEAARDRVFRYRYLLSPDESARRFDPRSLERALKAHLEALESVLPLADAREITADPTRAMRSLLEHWAGNTAPEQRHGVWFSPDGECALLMAWTQAPAFDLDAQARAVAAIEAAFSGLEPPDLSLALSGAPLFALASQETIRAEVTQLSLAASMAVMLILWIGYRSWRVLPFAAVPLASAVLAAMAVAGLGFGELYGITLGFGVTLLGVAIDYPIHLFSHRQASETVGRTLARIWPVLRLGVLSTALGYLAMITAGLPGLRQLGVFAVAGLLAAAAVTRWVLPALLPAGWTPRLHDPDARLPAIRWPRRGPAAVLAGAALGLGVIAAVVQPPVWEDDPAALSPVPQDMIERDRALRRALNAPDAGHLAVITAPDAETALRRSESLAADLARLVAAGRIAGFDLAARYLPSVRTQQARQAALPATPELEASLEQALAGLPFRREAFAPFLQAVAESRELPPLTPADIRGTALGTRVEPLLFESGGRWIALVNLAGVDDSAALGDWFAARGGAARYLEIRSEMTALMATTREVALTRIGWGALLITGLLWLGLRSGRRTLAVVGPVALALALTFAALLAAGGRLTLFHVVTGLLVLGVGVDYSLFFSQPDRQDASGRRTLHAITICVASTAAVFGLLALAEIPVLRAIGLTAAIGVSAAYLAALVLARSAASGEK